MDTFKQSNLWKKNLANQGDSDPYTAARERLRQAFIKARSAVEPLVGLIAKELPDLTMHDITHLDSLWDIADELIGDEFDINPAETFVLGMAFLLHDAACSTFAFPNGIDGLRATSEWKDFVAQKSFDEDAMKKGVLEYQMTLFETLRLLHSRQAEKLLMQCWPGLDGESRNLMEDIELRNYYGPHIGRIAASHGKDAAVAEQEWANAAPLTPPSSLGLDASAQWKVDRLKIAMLLRCIDAAHIDSRRAPDMLTSLIQPTGISREHWLFQNHLGSLAINDQDELYWSSRAFEEKDSDAWWRCYDTMTMIDREIRTANRILKNNGRNELLAKGVAGAQDLSIFVQNVPVQGWRPVDVSFQIRNVGSVIERFGGAKLYGDEPHLALRELIQNAADAIRARRLYRNKPEHGRIDIFLKEEDGAWWLHVQDNGIGMSRYVLTDVLLDFGRSLWRDAALREQWTGLAGKGFEAVGQFGIGFFSVFMLGDEIKVTTWRDGDAESNQATLYLRQRTNARPILLNTPTELKLDEPGTCVSVRLRNGRASLLEEFHTGGIRYMLSSSSPAQEMTLAQTVGILAPALDIDVWCQDGVGQKTKTIEANDWEKLSPIKLLQRLAPAYPETDLLQYTESFYNVSENNGTIVGRIGIDSPSISSFGYELGVLAHKGISMSKLDNMCGILLSSNNVDLARSLAKPICSAEALTTWAQTVHENIKHSSPWMTSKLLSLGVSAEHLPIIMLASKYITAEEFKAYLRRDGTEEIVLVWSENLKCPASISKADFDSQFKLSDDAFVLGSFTERQDFGWGEWVSSQLPETPESPRNIISAINQCFQQTWSNVKWTKEMRNVGKVVDEDINVECSVARKA